MMQQHNIVSVSGGKDSTATLLVARAWEVPNLAAVFADTGHEHPETYDYVGYLEHAIGIPIRWVRADFSDRIAAKRVYVATMWPKKGVPQSIVDQALAVLHPTGNPFLDLCLWKGLFPSTKARFCTDELKRNPIIEQVFMPVMDEPDYGMALSWQGVRADESLNRRYLPECDEVGGGLFNFRPILKWDVAEVFAAHRYAGIKPNPLYLQGAGRVGCMPCINCAKDELRHIALRWPEEIARVREWEQLVSLASKRGASTFFAAVNDPTYSDTDTITHETYGIDRMVEWAMTTRGGRQFDMFARLDSDGCSSSYGLCEAPMDAGAIQIALEAV
ncbi:phosphoadenosine phosphosulfate reductase family protein [Achromobacter xylosoxidans]|uniref:phosphoadenosine phosphosulfate reductase family protein n=1 Tax=Alcaligenes xylosoxydans xylosoxydans TaxID=85698 RepID=UPI002ACA2A85|nr:phosphoadenosine phosphosulfate reductase family protein [Achromobacter xylosoxidans]MDZ5616723.1 phosphoadenosine phosphosulfate reductase family protein [Achromobacter xylosoxidans]MDZ5626125.1 phosphoadenosine phosphosulfate reductase family protein [Achromobacter xylosoxidans]MDZ5686883.1 phosphoadenosine phosphosulfate reductase family protein [Achromobacter xylosoxidans]